MMILTSHFNYITLISIILIGWFIIIFLLRNNFVMDSETSVENPIMSSINNNVSVKYTRKHEIKLPKSKLKYHVPRFMLELYESNKFRKDNNYYNGNGGRPDVVRSLIPTHAGSITNNEIVDEQSDGHLLIFDLPSSEDEEEFIGAELKILTLVEIDPSALSGVERQLKISIYDDNTKNLYHFQQLHIYHFNNTWLSFNITQPVTRILQQKVSKRFLKIIITIDDFLPYYKEEDNILKLSLMPITENLEHDYPILLLSYTSKNHKKIESVIARRQKRSLEEDYEEETNHVWDDEVARKLQMKKLKRYRNSCRRRPLFIDFSEIDYDSWIVQPSGYEAYQCQGKCFYPVAEHLNPTKHAIVQALLHSVAPSKTSRSCCVPTALDSISILYVDNNGVLTYRYAYNDMVVLECGCR